MRPVPIRDARPVTTKRMRRRLRQKQLHPRPDPVRDPPTIVFNHETHHVLPRRIAATRSDFAIPARVPAYRNTLLGVAGDADQKRRRRFIRRLRSIAALSLPKKGLRHLSPRRLDSDAVAQLQADFRGEIVEPGDPSYDELREVFNGMYSRRPRLILRPQGAADVIRAIGLAKMSGVPLAIRGGGHSVAGFSGIDDGIVLDMRSMRGIRVDPATHTVRAQAGLNWGELDRETQAFGLAVTGGRVTTTGIVGFTLGTGSGWLERKFGFAADNLLRADVVTAEGEIVTASEHENQELLWGLKGGGGNFGVVTEVEFKLRPLAPIVYAGLAAFPPDQAGEVVRTWRDLSHGSDDIGWATAFVTAPPQPVVTEE